MTTLFDEAKVISKAAPRPYQQEALNAILRDHDEGFSRVLCVAATGTGKTNIISWAVDKRRGWN